MKEGFMVNKSRWIYNYNSLNPDSQLVVAEAIANELKNNESYLDAEDEYDEKKSRIVREFLNSIINNSRQSEEVKKFADIFKEYENLSQNNRKKVINEVFKIVVKYLGIQEQEDKEKICQQEGHTFSKWKYNKWTEYIDIVIDHQHVPNYPVEHENWERTCSRCGFIEKVEHEPQELIDERKEKNKKERIKILERELKKLKSE